MFCLKCGNELPDGTKFCDKCGANLGGNATINTKMLKNTASQYSEKVGSALKNSSMRAMSDAEENQYDVSGNSKELQEIFVEPDEELLGKLGNGYMVNLLFKKTKKCSALLSDKRVYLKGSFYNSTGKNIIETIEERILDLEDITGTGFIYTGLSMPFLAFLAILILIGVFTIFHRSPDMSGSQVFMVTCSLIIAGIFAWKKVMMSRTTWFFIDYAGGRIMIDAKLIGIADVQDFHKQMRRAKDAVTGKK